MTTNSATRLAVIVALALLAGGCGKKSEPPAPADARPPAELPPDTLPEAPPAEIDDNLPDSPADFADGTAGGPDTWVVTGADEDFGLNLRAGPSGNEDIIGALANGDVVQNLGCEMSGDTRWCQVQTPGDMPARGWVPGEFLEESGAP
jgi:Bacterial SH3 domain